MSMYLLPEKSTVHGTYATLAGSGISISKPERTHHYTEFLGHVFRTNGLPADLALKWVSVGANYPRLRSFLVDRLQSKIEEGRKVIIGYDPHWKLYI
jgi:hypothetical protein